jgi:hypothetical protein
MVSKRRSLKGGAAIFSLALVAILAFSALSVGAASAAEAPRWKVNGTYIGAGTSKAFTTTSTNEVVLSFKSGFYLASPAGECTQTGEIEGSAAGAPGTKKNVVLTCKKVKVFETAGKKELVNCTVKSAGAEVGTIKTNSLKGTLVWLNASGAAAGDLVEPTSGTNWATIEILGAACAAAQKANITGQGINQFLPVDEEVETAQLAFPSTAILNYYNNETSRAKQTISQLKYGAVTATLSGNFNLSLTSKEKMGVITAMPTATTEAATGLTYTGATLNASVNPKGLSTTYQYEYGLTEAYGSKVPAAPKSAGEGTGLVKVPEAVKGLTEGTTYHYRVVATNSAGTTYGADKTLTTLAYVASEEPRWKVNGAFLGSGETKAFTATNTTTMILKTNLFTIKMPTCTEAGKLTGSGSKQPGGKKEVVLTCTGASIEGYPSCTVSSGFTAGKIVTNNLKSTLARLSSEGSASIGEVTEAEGGGSWFTPVFEGTCPVNLAAAFTGQSIGQDAEAGVGKEVKTLGLSFPETALLKYWNSPLTSPKCEEKFVSNGLCERSITQLRWGASQIATLSGSMNSSLTSEELFGIFIG